MTDGAGGPVVRDATEADLDAITRIYDQSIVDDHVSFDTEPWTREKRWAWWADRRDEPRLPVLVAELDGAVVGATYASWFRPKAAYERTVETTIVVDRDHLRLGLGTLLYTALLDRLVATGAHRAYAVIALPNDGSVALHHRLGFVDNGVQHEVGFKLGSWWSTLTLEKRLDG